jgi:hypothetical protein
LERIELREDKLSLASEVERLKKAHTAAQEKLEITESRQHAAEAILADTKELLSRLGEEIAEKRKELEAKGGELAEAQQRVFDTQDKANELTKAFLETYDRQQQERKRLAQSIEQLQKEQQTLAAQNTELTAANSRLTADLSTVKKDLASASQELSRTRQAQRAYILETLRTKAKSAVPVSVGKFLSPFYELSELATRLAEQGSYETLSFETLWYLPAGQITLGTLGRLEDISPQTGRQVVESLFDTREWELLRESERRQLQDEVRGFMDIQRAVFESPLQLDPKVTRPYAKAFRKRLLLESARRANQKVIVKEGEAKRVPSDADIAEARKFLGERERILEKERRRAESAIKKFHEEIDNMVHTLSPVKKRTPLR